MEPHYPFNRSRAERAVAFTDSIATAFGVPPLTALTYYLTPTVDEIYRIMGLDNDVSISGVGSATTYVSPLAAGEASTR